MYGNCLIKCAGMKKIKFIYFDLGGVVVNHILGLVKAAKMLHLDPNDAISFFLKHAEDLDRGVLSLADFENSFETHFDIKNRVDKKLGECIVENFEPIQETHDLIYKLSRDFSIGILSNISVDVFYYIKKNGLIPDISYDSTVISAELKVVKPEKAIFDIALSKAAVSPAEILFIDDIQENIEAAVSFGWNGILFDTNNPQKSIQLVEAKIELENSRTHI